MSFLKNIQLQQLINLLLLIFLGLNTNTLQANIFTIIILMLFASFLELLCKKELYIPYSAAITSLGVVLMVGWTLWYIPFVVITLAILQKHYLKIDYKHIFNPSNFALILAIFIFYPKALPIIGEIGKSSIIVFIVILIGSLILLRVNRYLITIAYLISYIALNYIINANSDPYWNSEHFISSLYSTSFIVYIFFMLTDPVTTPSKTKHQIYFGISVAIVNILLNYFIGVRLWHQFLALFLVTILFTPIYRNLTNYDKKKLTIILLLSLTIAIYISTLKPLFFSM